MVDERSRLLGDGRLECDGEWEGQTGQFWRELTVLGLKCRGSEAFERTEKHFERFVPWINLLLCSIFVLQPNLSTTGEKSLLWFIDQRKRVPAFEISPDDLALLCFVSEMKALTLISLLSHLQRRLQILLNWIRSRSFGYR
ncbi:hypothetical protein TorRG33x02_180560 [Trema orientale]|uniref:Uncharacterized protein n=1 Tax=Trema orientale TaxID=63057 RepID=A0A2P5EKZ7_TREOI|nr:hypothetical protein TorRG33x02_180560 [Trema orientale]